MTAPTGLAGELGTVLYEAETNFDELVSTFGTRLSVIGQVDCSGLQQPRLDVGRTEQYLQGDSPRVPGLFSGSFKTTHRMCGHGSATSGAMTGTDNATLLGRVLGGYYAGFAGTTFTGGTASVPTTTASGTAPAGSLCRSGLGMVGVTAADGRGNGQFAAIGTHVTTTLTLLTALPGAPTNGDVMHSAELAYTTETSAAFASSRWLLQTGNLQYECHGCWPMSVAFSGLGFGGGIPTFEVTWGVTSFKLSTTTFPSAVAVQAFAPAACGGGNSSFYLQTLGTVTRALRSVRDFTITVNLGAVPIPGPGGGTPFSLYVGATRTPSEIIWEWTEDAPAATLTPQSDTDWAEAKHGLAMFSGTAGSAMCAYSPNLLPDGNRPVQFVDSGSGINRCRYRYKAATGTTTTTDLTLSALRFGWA